MPRGALAGPQAPSPRGWLCPSCHPNANPVHVRAALPHLRPPTQCFTYVHAWRRYWSVAPWDVRGAALPSLPGWGLGPHTVHPVVAAGSRVLARWNLGESVYPGTVAQVNIDGTFDVRYDDGGWGPGILAPPHFYLSRG